MKNRLERRYGQHHLHFITCSCYRRRSPLGSVRARNIFVEVLGEIRTRYQFALVGLVEHPKDWRWSSYAFYQQLPNPLISIDYVE